jgi:hypothetical protein
MNEQQRPNFITMNDVLRNWRASLERRGRVPDEKVAAAIVDVVLFSDVFDRYYADDPAVAEFYDLASDLEWSNGAIPEDWQELQRQLAKLEKRYGQPGELPLPSDVQ